MKVVSGLSSAMGAQSSIGEAPLSTGWRKPRGMTPTIVIGSSSSRTVFPITDRSPPKRRCHRSYEISATYPIRPPSSALVKSRPSAGATPSSEK